MKAMERQHALKKQSIEPQKISPSELMALDLSSKRDEGMDAVHNQLSMAPSHSMTMSIDDREDREFSRANTVLIGRSRSGLW